ncbi:TolC family protein [bacterium]|nr:TolC family protein [bacterium]
MTSRSVIMPVLVLAAWAVAASVAMAQEDNRDEAKEGFPESYTAESAGTAPATAWWMELGDPRLNELIEQGLEQNPNLSAARERVVASKAQATGSLAPLLPHASVELGLKRTSIEFKNLDEGEYPVTSCGSSASSSSGGSSFSSTNFDDPIVTDSGSAYLVGNWQLDVFGKNAFAYAANRKEALASQGDRDTDAASLAANIAGAYYDVIAARAKVRAVEKQIQANQKMLDLMQLRFETGVASGLDVLQQKQVLASSKTRLPNTRLELRLAEQTLATLLNQQPTQTVAIDADALPEIPALERLDEPAALPANRPDVEASYERMRAARNRKYSAIGGFLPTLTVTGQYGQERPDYDVDQVNEIWFVGAGLSIPIFQGGSNIATYRANAANYRAARQDYRALQLTAVRRVEAAVARDREMHEALTAYQGQFEAAQAALDQSTERYLTGLTDYVSVLAAINAKQAAELSVIQTHRQMIDARLALYDAVGGAWMNDLSMPAKDDES